MQVTPDVMSDGEGKMGVQLASSVTITHTKPANIVEQAALTLQEFNRCPGNRVQQILMM